MTKLILNESPPEGIELNELSVKSNGGTELMQRRLMDGNVNRDLLRHFQIIASRVRHVDENLKKILWLHDLPGDPESAHLADPKSRNRFDKIVMVSDWQMNYYHLSHGIPYSRCIVMPNAIYPIEIKEKEYDGTIRLIYHTTPHRGLEILIPVFENLCKEEKILGPIHLDVYSSFSIYGWEQRDEPYRGLFDRCRNHPNITYHGAVSNEDVRNALVKSHIFAYPSIWPETSCLSAIEAMSAMCSVVCPNLAALPETCSKFANMYQFDEDINRHAQRFGGVLASTIMNRRRQLEDSKSVEVHYRFQKSYFDNFYSWPNRAKQWESLLKSLL